MFWVRVAVALALIALVIALMARRKRRIRTATLDQSTLRRRVSSLPSGYRRIEGRLDPLGFRTIGDFDLCDRNGKRVHRMLISWNERDATLSLRGMHVAGFFTALSGREVEPQSIVVQTSLFDVDHTHPRYVVQTVRGVKHGTERALLDLHAQAIALLGQEGWDERLDTGDPVGFALAVLVEGAEARSIGSARPNAVGSARMWTYANGRAQVGSAIRRLDPAGLDDAGGGPPGELGA